MVLCNGGILSIDDLVAAIVQALVKNMLFMQKIQHKLLVVIGPFFIQQTYEHVESPP